MPQLDALRALAVSAVVAEQGVPSWGGADYGVKLFFVLSGFLITGLLLRSRSGVEQSVQTWRAALGRFYVRRVLRTLPVYYLVVGVAVFINLEPARDIFWWLVTHTVNIKMSHQGWYEANVAHFWTLAVEEQFYLIWPWVILLLPRRWLIPAALLMIGLAVSYRMQWVLSGFGETNSKSINLATWTSLDSIGIGALLALLADRRVTTAVLDRWLLWTLGPLALVAVVGLPRLSTALNIILYPTALALLFGAVIHAAARGVPGLLGAILESKPLTYIGKISYGIYVLHPFTPAMLQYAMRRLHWRVTDPNTLSAAAVVMTLVLASLSWFLLEGPINRLKQGFQDPPAPA